MGFGKELIVQQIKEQKRDKWRSLKLAAAWRASNSVVVVIIEEEIFLIDSHAAPALKTNPVAAQN